MSLWAGYGASSGAEDAVICRASTGMTIPRREGDGLRDPASPVSCGQGGPAFRKQHPARAFAPDGRPTADPLEDAGPTRALAPELGAGCPAPTVRLRLGRQCGTPGTKFQVLWLSPAPRTTPSEFPASTPSTMSSLPSLPAPESLGAEPVPGAPQAQPWRS